MDSLRTQLRAAVLPDGTRTLIVELAIPEDAPHAVREGIARRHIVSGGGTCPCGARYTLPPRRERRRRKLRSPMYVAVLHEDGCPAGERTLDAAIAAWQNRRTS